MKIKFMPDGYFAILLAVSIVLNSTFPIMEIIPFPWSLFGISLVTIGLLIAFITNSLLIRKKTSIKTFELPNALITSGPFKFSRNPIYLSMAIILFGVVLILGSLSPFISPIVFIIIINKIFIPTEENNLAKVFGKKYIAYKRSVNRWI